MAASSTIGHIGEFEPDKKSISAYLDLFFEANEIAQGKQVTWILNSIEAKTHSLVHTLVAPSQPKGKSFDQIVTALKEHFEPKCLIIACRFYFHHREQISEEVQWTILLN